MRIGLAVRDGNVVKFITGFLIGDIAYQVQTVAIGWHVYSLRHAPLDLGLVGLFLFLPTFVFALPAGLFADHNDRRLIVTATTLAEALGCCALFAAVATNVTATWPYFAILTVIGTTRAFGAPAERAILPGIVDRDGYLKIQATYSALREFTVIGGPPLGGALVAFSTQLAFATCAVMLLISAAIIFTVRLLAHAAVERPPPPTLATALEGVTFIASRPIVAGAISLDLFAVLFGGANALFPAFAADVFKVGPGGLGLLQGAGAVGAAIVAAVLARKTIERHVGPTLFIVVAIFGLATVGFALSHNFILSLALLAIAGGADMVSVVIRSGLVQLGTPPNMRGRVGAVENVFIGASNQLGAFESGTVAALIGTVPSVIVGGIGTLIVVAGAALIFPALRGADRFPVVEEAEAVEAPGSPLA